MRMIHSYDEIKTLFDNCGITAREADFDKSKPTPYIAYYRSHENSIRANGRTIYTIIKMRFSKSISGITALSLRNPNACSWRAKTTMRRCMSLSW